ncbi:MAG: hypothetical protein QXJ22_06135 [Ignisphaera sp.]
MATLTTEEKVKFLRTLEEDAEFRYAVAGLLGLDTVISELRKLREDFLMLVREQEKKWEENNKRWEENNRRWEENDRKWEENFKRWEENNKRWEENNRRWEEAYKRFEAIEKRLEAIELRLEEHSKILEEHSKAIRELIKRVSRLELAVGALTEASFARYIHEDLYIEASSRGEKILRRIRNYRVDETDIDLYMETDSTVYVIEVKIKPRHEDIGRIVAKVDLVRMKHPEKNVIGVLATTMIGREVEEYALQKGVKVYRY